MKSWYCFLKKDPRKYPYLNFSKLWPWPTWVFLALESFEKKSWERRTTKGSVVGNGNTHDFAIPKYLGDPIFLHENSMKFHKKN